MPEIMLFSVQAEQSISDCWFFWRLHPVGHDFPSAFVSASPADAAGAHPLKHHRARVAKNFKDVERDLPGWINRAFTALLADWRLFCSGGGCWLFADCPGALGGTCLISIKERTWIWGREQGFRQARDVQGLLSVLLNKKPITASFIHIPDTGLGVYACVCSCILHINGSFPDTDSVSVPRGQSFTNMWCEVFLLALHLETVQSDSTTPLAATENVRHGHKHPTRAKLKNV